MSAVIYTKQNDRLDLICFAYYGSVANRQVEQVLLANPGLEQQPILLPMNIPIKLPDLTPPIPQKIVPQIALWT